MEPTSLRDHNMRTVTILPPCKSRNLLINVSFLYAARLLEYLMFLHFKTHWDCHVIYLTYDIIGLWKKNHQKTLKISRFSKKIRSRKIFAENPKKSEKSYWKSYWILKNRNFQNFRFPIRFSMEKFQKCFRDFRDFRLLFFSKIMNFSTDFDDLFCKVL